MSTEPDQQYFEILMRFLDPLPDPVFVKDQGHRWVAVNEAFCTLLGKTRDELLLRSDFDFSPYEEAAVFWEFDRKVFETGEESLNLEHHTNTIGQKRIIETKKRRLIAGEQMYLVGVIRDLTTFTEIQTQLAYANRELEARVQERTAELDKINGQLHQMAFFDQLTELPNRRLLFSAVERRVLQPNAKFSVFYFDLDNFKWINDALGHGWGDRLLAEIATRLRLLANFSLIARVGGDEFVAIGQEDAPNDQVSLAQRARELLSVTEKPVQIEQREVSSSFSVGIARFPDDGTDVSQLLRSADAAMYRAKERGRNQYAFFSEQQSAKAGEQLQLEAGLRRALRNRQIQIAFQPIFEVKSGKKVGVEALARWEDPELGVISPDRFIPVAESSGLIHELSSYVLRLSLRLAQKLLPEPLWVAVNLSALQMDRITLVEDVRRALADSNFPARRLELEITESVATRRREQLSQVTQALTEMGVGFALDDFGTGYSSLAHLQKLPVSRIKIDRSFVSQIEDNAKSRALIEAMVRMGQALEMRTLAEGVETHAQREFLTQIGCDEIQGYLLAKPTLMKTAPPTSAS
jgi:diguanylate cyclase